MSGDCEWSVEPEPADGFAIGCHSLLPSMPRGVGRPSRSRVREASAGGAVRQALLLRPRKPVGYLGKGSADGFAGKDFGSALERSECPLVERFGGGSSPQRGSSDPQRVDPEITDRGRPPAASYPTASGSHTPTVATGRPPIGRPIPEARRRHPDHASRRPPPYGRAPPRWSSRSHRSPIR